MMKQNNPLRRLLAALLAALTLVSFTILPVLGAAEDEAADTEAAETTEATAPKAEETEMEIISISTEDDLIALAASCTLDAWSREKHVVLEADLDLTGLTFSPIATFGGTFDGQGHTIRGLAITDALSPAGLICTLQPTGRVENLHIEGSVAPAGDPVSTGGLVGEAQSKIAPSPARSPAAGPPAASSAKTRPAACSAAAARAAPSTVRTAPADSWAATLA